MAKALLLFAVVLLSGWVGSMGVSRVRARRDVLMSVREDVLKLGTLLTEQHMPLFAALERLNGRAAPLYRLLRQELQKAPKELSVSPRQWNELAAQLELTAEDAALIGEYFCAVSECFSAEEIRLTTVRFSETLKKASDAVEQRELKRAGLLRRVWLVGGLGAALLLI